MLSRVFIAALIVLAGCASKPVEKEKPRTEAELRAILAPATTDRALATIAEAAVRRTLERHFRERSREAARRGRSLAVERALISETIGIGDGMGLARVFALFHEYDEAGFTSYLSATEHVAGRIRLALETRVGGARERLAELDFVELDRAVLKLSLYADKDERCCPSKLVRSLYGLRGLTLEALD